MCICGFTCGAPPQKMIVVTWYTCTCTYCYCLDAYIMTLYTYRILLSCYTIVRVKLVFPACVPAVVLLIIDLCLYRLYISQIICLLDV